MKNNDESTDLNAFVEWAKKKKSRSVKIVMERGKMNIWVYDYDLMAGQFCKNVDEIDLDAVKVNDAKTEYEQLGKFLKEHGVEVS